MLCKCYMLFSAIFLLNALTAVAYYYDEYGGDLVIYDDGGEDYSSSWEVHLGGHDSIHDHGSRERNGHDHSGRDRGGHDHGSSWEVHLGGHDSRHDHSSRDRSGHDHSGRDRSGHDHSGHDHSGYDRRICKSSSGKYSDPYDCAKYYECKHWVPKHKRCGRKERFDPKKHKCVDKKKVPCFGGADSSGDSSSEEVTVKQFKCPYQFGVWPHPKDCSKYYLCKFSKATELHCSNHELFDDHKRKCKSRHSVRCGSRIDPYDIKVTKKPPKVTTPRTTFSTNTPTPPRTPKISTQTTRPIPISSSTVSTTGLITSTTTEQTESIVETITGSDHTDSGRVTQETSDERLGSSLPETEIVSTDEITSSAEETTTEAFPTDTIRPSETDVTETETDEVITESTSDEFISVSAVTETILPSEQTEVSSDEESTVSEASENPFASTTEKGIIDLDTTTNSASGEITGDGLTSTMVSDVDQTSKEIVTEDTTSSITEDINTVTEVETDETVETGDTSTPDSIASSTAEETTLETEESSASEITESTSPRGGNIGFDTTTPETGITEEQTEISTVFPETQSTVEQETSSEQISEQETTWSEINEVSTLSQVSKQETESMISEVSTSGQVSEQETSSETSEISTLSEISEQETESETSQASTTGQVSEQEPVWSTTVTDEFEPSSKEITFSEPATVGSTRKPKTKRPRPTIDPDCTPNGPKDVSYIYECPKKFGHFPHPSCDNLFIHCDGWKPFTKQCGEGLKFSPEYMVCVWPEEDDKYDNDYDSFYHD